MYIDVEVFDIKSLGNPDPDHNPDGDTSRWLRPVIYLLYNFV